jgi:hypothetical protein
MKNSKKYKTGSSVIIMIIFLMLSFSSYVYEHRVYLFAWEEGEQLYSELFQRYLIGSDGIIRVFNM